jgi:hypothetical protein
MSEQSIFPYAFVLKGSHLALPHDLLYSNTKSYARTKPSRTSSSNRMYQVKGHKSSRNGYDYTITMSIYHTILTLLQLLGS